MLTQKNGSRKRDVKQSLPFVVAIGRRGAAANVEEHQEVTAKLKRSTKSFAAWLRMAQKIHKERGSAADVRFCLQNAYFNAKDLDQSLLHFSRDVVGRGRYEKKFGKMDWDDRKHFFPFLTRPGNYKMLQASRGTWKSSICVQDFAAWRIGRNYLLNGTVDTKILVVSEVNDLPRRNMRGILRILGSKTYQYLAGEHQPHDQRVESLAWGVEQSHSRHKSDLTNADPTLMSMGMGQERTGFHFNLIIADDLMAQRSSGSLDMIENCYEFYQLLQSILDPGGEMLLVSTRWHADDIYGRIDELNDALDPDSRYQTLYLPAKDEEGTLRFPKILPQKTLDRLFEQQGPYIFAAQYMLTPVHDEDKKFRMEWVKYITPFMLNQKLNVYTTADVAWTVLKRVDFRSSKSRRDPSVVTTIAIDERWNHITLDVYRDWAPIDEVIREMYRQWETHGSICTILQKYDDRGLSQSIEQYGYDIGKQMPVEWIAYPPGGGKETRIENDVQPLFAALKMFILPGMDWFIKEELHHWPKSKHDDFLDCICNVHKVGRPPQKTSLTHNMNAEQRAVALLKQGIDPDEFEDVKGEEPLHTPSF